MAVQKAKERVRRRAAKQAGTVARFQLRWLGIERGTIESWLRTGYLIPVLPGVYRVGHAAPSREADLWAAVLYARSGAALSHGTAAHWRGLINYPPREIHISTPHKIKSLPGIVVHGRRPLPRYLYNGIPVTSIPQTMLDLAADYEHNVIRHALAQLDFRHELNIPKLLAITGSGRPGSLNLNRAIVEHPPRLAFVNGPIVELDGGDNHSSPAQMKFDRQKDFALRRAGLIVFRYTWDLLHDEPDLVEREIRRTLKVREGWTRGDSTF
jgi:hypothetical protein